MRPIIRVENLSKQYVIGGAQEPYSTFRESLVKAARKPLKALKRGDKKNGLNRFWALKDVNFEVMPGEVVGIIGRNGAGKSTLLKILSRITEPTRGRIELYGRVGSLLEVGTGFHPELTGRENIYLNGAILGMRREEIVKKFDEIVDFAEVEDFLDTPVKRYSSGMYTRLAFAVAANLEPEVLIVDEVLSVGDAEFQKKCLGKMQEVSEKEGRTILFVSHNVSAIMNLCSTGILLGNGQIIQMGNITELINNYLQNDKNLHTIASESEIINFASVEQINEEIHISVNYNLEKSLEIPNLGFVISDVMGNPICGSNVLIDKALGFKSSKCGNIKVKIVEPKLLDGNYKLSIWFGNEVENFFSGKDLLSFEVINMTRKQHGVPSVVGYAYPKCFWEFSQ